MSRNGLGGVGRVGRWRRKEERVLGPVSRVGGGGKDPDSNGQRGVECVVSRITDALVQKEGESCGLLTCTP